MFPQVSYQIYNCDALCYLIPFVLIKKREKHPWNSNTPPWVFSRFLNSANGIKSRKASQ